MAMELNEQGFITHYLVSGCKETEFSSRVSDKNQLRCEKMMRGEVAVHNTIMPEGPIAVGAVSCLGLPWEYYYNYGNWFVDKSAFYPLLTKVEVHASTLLCAPKEMEAVVWLWSYAAIDLWVNGQYEGGIETPVYKPITRRVMKLHLKEGKNLIYICLQNLGVRDTRSLFGIQVPGQERELLTCELPDMESGRTYIKEGEWLSGITMDKGVLNFPWKAPAGSRLVYDLRPVDFTEYKNRYTYQPLTGTGNVSLAAWLPYCKVEIQIGNQCLSRSFERQEILAPVYSQVADEKANRRRIYDRIASVGQIPRGDTESFSLYPILARCAESPLRHAGGNSAESPLRYSQRNSAAAVLPEDEKEIYKSLDQIESRRDCSDFLTCALVRFLKLYPMEEPMAVRCKEVCLNYRYWMDEQGNDGMCFWSENHSLMFFVSAYIAGDLYPEEIFVRSGRTGRQMKELAGARIHDWLEESIRDGFDEFHSGGYSPITFAAILNVVDFGEEALSELAVKSADRLLGDLAHQTFKGVSISPMGRVYGEVLYPYAQDIQCLVNLMDPQTPDRFSEWIIFLATSRYEIPADLKDKMKEPLSMVYDESNARICVERTQDYMLTSVESPRDDGRSRTWENISSDPDADMAGFSYVKSLNECFHGTTQFQPGVFGYQQHMWYAALDPAAVIFTNHPGGSCEASSTRPGYWFGNGIMPALKQEKELLLAIYQIPETHPIPFTHLYWPKSRFEEERMEGGWLTGRAGSGYVGIWCSSPLIPHRDRLTDCEYRANSRNAAYVCVCGSNRDYESLQAFTENCRKMKPGYDSAAGSLRAGEQMLTYVTV